MAEPRRWFYWPGRVTCLRVVDGDTIHAEFDLGFGVARTEKRLRLAGIDAAELRAADPVKRRHAQDAKTLLEQLLPPGTVFSARTDPDPEKFGGFLAWITLADGTDVNARLLADGLAQPYDGGRR